MELLNSYFKGIFRFSFLFFISCVGRVEVSHINKSPNIFLAYEVIAMRILSAVL